MPRRRQSKCWVLTCLKKDLVYSRPISEVTTLISLPWTKILLLSQLSETFLTWLHFNKLSLQVTWSLEFSLMRTWTVTKMLKILKDEIHISCIRDIFWSVKVHVYVVKIIRAEYCETCLILCKTVLLYFHWIRQFGKKKVRWTKSTFSAIFCTLQVTSLMGWFWKHVIQSFLKFSIDYDHFSEQTNLCLFPLWGTLTVAFKYLLSFHQKNLFRCMDFQCAEVNCVTQLPVCVLVSSKFLKLLPLTFFCCFFLLLLPFSTTVNDYNNGKFTLKYYPSFPGTTSK